MYLSSNQKLTTLHKGSFNNYVDRRERVGGQSNVYPYKVNDLFLFTPFVYEGWVVKKVQKSVYVVIECPLTRIKELQCSVA